MTSIRATTAVLVLLTTLLISAMPLSATGHPTSTSATSALGTKKVVMLFNDSISTNAPTYSQPSGPQQEIWDALSGHLFVSTSSGDVIVLAGVTDTLLGAYAVGNPLAGIALDNKTSRIFVAEPTVNQVAVLNESTGVVVARIGVGSSPQGVLFNPITDRVYVANSLSNNLSVIDPGSNLVARSIPGLYGATSLTLDSLNGHVFVAGWPSDCGNAYPVQNCVLSQVNTTSHKVMWNLTVPPVGQMAFDPVNGDLYAPQPGNGTVSVLDRTTGRMVAVVHTGPLGGGEGPITAAFDPLNGMVYVMNKYAANFTVINTSTNRMSHSTPRTSQTNVQSLVFDISTGQLYGVDMYGPASYAYSLTTLTITTKLGLATQPYGVIYDPFNSKVYVHDYLYGTLYALNGSTGKIVSQVAGSATATDHLAVNPLNGTVFEPNGSGILTLSAGGKVGALSDPFGPNRLTFDSATGDLYAVDTSPSGVSIIHVASNHIVRTLHFSGWTVSGLAYDALNGWVYAPMWSGSEGSYVDKILEINGTTKSSVGNISIPSPLGNETGSAVFDPRTHDLFVANMDIGGSSNNLLVVSVSSASVVGVVAVGNFRTLDLAFDGGNGYIYAAIEGSNAGTVIMKISAVTLKVVAQTTIAPGGYSPGGLTVDGHTGQIWATVQGSGLVFVLGA